MVSREQYEQGLNCRGICCICQEKLGCYQYQVTYPNLPVPTKPEIKVVDEVNSFVQKLACFGCPLVCTTYQFNMEDKDCIKAYKEAEHFLKENTQTGGVICKNLALK